MPVFESAVELTGASPEGTVGQDYCEVTNRILIVSPRPAMLRALISELSVRCYDVMLFHHADDPVLNVLQGNVVLVDRTADAPGAPEVRLRQTAPGHIVTLLPAGRPEAGGRLPDGSDSMPWPCPIDRALAVIEAAVVCNRVMTGESASLVFKDLLVDIQRMIVTRSDERVELTKTEFDLLRTIVSAGGRALSRQELMDHIWGENYFGGSNAVDVHIRSLRSKLGDDPRNPAYIATVRSVGYRLADD